jgi:formylglycine-generating enzyme required for sulfatase activity
MKISTLLKTLTLIFCGCLLSASSNKTDQFAPKKNWESTVLAYQKVYLKHLKESGFKPYQSPVLKVKDSPIPIEIDISGLQYLKLYVGGTKDGNHMDHAAWGNAYFTDLSGNRVEASKVPVMDEAQGWSSLTFNKNLMGNTILLGKKDYKNGIAMHADGHAIFQLDGQYKLFTADIGVEQDGGNKRSSLFFRIDDNLSFLLLDKLSTNFPKTTNLLKKYCRSEAHLIVTDQADSLVQSIAFKMAETKGISNLVLPYKEKSSKTQLVQLTKMMTVYEALDALDQINPKAIMDAYQHLSETYGPAYTSQLKEKQEALKTFIVNHKALQEELKQGQIEKLSDVLELTQLAKDVQMANPLLQNRKVLMVRQKIKQGDARHVMADKLGVPPNNWTTSAAIHRPHKDWDNDLVVVENLRNPRLKSIYKPDKPVVINDPDVHFDGDRILFSSVNDNKRWNLFEIDADGSNLKQLTPEGYNDVDFFDGCYLPNGKIAMVSTAPYQGVPCIAGGQSTGSVFLLDPSTKNIRQLNFGQDNDWNPVVLNNGRIMYLRWEYTDASHYFTRILMHMNPDGTGKKEYYGSNSYWPNSLFEARPLPGRSSQFVGIVSGHHGTVRSGHLVLFDPAKGRHEADGVVQEIPFRDRPIKPIIKDQLVDGVWPQFLSAYPLDDHFFLATAKPTPESLWGLYLVDVFDNMTLITEQEGEALINPLLLEKRETPPIIPEKVKLSDTTSTVYIANIYEGPGLKGVPKGSVKQLRIFAYHFSYNYTGGHDVIGIQSGWDVKRILGTVPVESDGSAIFTIPANTPVSLQPLDENGRAMQLMRSWFTGMPGEFISCVGCHENQNSLPPVRATLASRKLPDSIEPFYGGTRPFTYNNEIQPLLDRKCSACHNGSNKLPDFSDKHESGYRNLSGSYKALHPYVRRPGPESDLHLLTPMDFHAGTSELIQLLEKGHHNVNLTPEEWDRLHTWIDLNVPYHGQFNPPAFCQNDQKDRRQELANTFGGYKVNLEEELKLANYLRTLQDTVPVKPVKKSPSSLKTTANSPKWSFGVNKAIEKQEQLGTISKTIELKDGLQLKLIKIPAGEFVDQNGVRKEVNQSFWMGQFEVSNAQYNHFFPDHDSRYIAQFWKDHTTPGYPVNYPEHPVVRVSWEECQAFCEKLSKETGFTFKLPSASQWEWACRAGSADHFWFGDRHTDFSDYENLADSNLSDFAVIGVNPKPMGEKHHLFPYYNFIPQANFNDRNMISCKPGEYKANPWGLYDMHGNVSEWVSNDDAIKNNQSVHIQGSKKIVKGGSWRDRPKRSGASFERAYYPWQKVMNVGFRVIMEEK